MSSSGIPSSGDIGSVGPTRKAFLWEGRNIAVWPAPHDYPTIRTAAQHDPGVTGIPASEEGEASLTETRKIGTCPDHPTSTSRLELNFREKHAGTPS